MPKNLWKCSRSSAPFPTISGDLWAENPSRTPPNQHPKFPPPLRLPTDSPKTSRSGASSFSAAPQSMPICKQQDSSMTTCHIALGIKRCSSWRGKELLLLPRSSFYGKTKATLISSIPRIYQKWFSHGKKKYFFAFCSTSVILLV